MDGEVVAWWVWEIAHWWKWCYGDNSVVGVGGLVDVGGLVVVGDLVGVEGLVDIGGLVGLGCLVGVGGDRLVNMAVSYLAFDLIFINKDKYVILVNVIVS